MEFLFTVLGFLLLGLVLVAVVVAALTLGFGAGLAKTIEWLADKLIPGRSAGVGVEGLLGETARVVRPLVETGEAQPTEGLVQFNGELWKAQSRAGISIPAGQRVRVVGVERLVVMVELDDG